MIQDWREKTTRELGRTPNHVYLAPHMLLRGMVAHYTIWTATGVEEPCPGALTLVPDAAGCLVMYWDGARFYASLWGATTCAVTVNSSGAPVRLFVEFLPGGLYYFLGACQNELADGRFALEELAPCFYRALCALFERARSLEELAAGFDALLLPIMLAKTPPPVVLSAAAALNGARGMLSIRELSTQEGYSPRHLDRLLAQHLGMGPKVFARILRINTAVKRMESGLPLTFLAQETGFYDQAHFIRDFKRICGVTPGFCRDNMSDFYKEPFKL